jgi:hypothetical protein
MTQRKNLDRVGMVSKVSDNSCRQMDDNTKREFNGCGTVAFQLLQLNP